MSGGSFVERSEAWQTRRSAEGGSAVACRAERSAVTEAWKAAGAPERYDTRIFKKVVLTRKQAEYR